MKKLIPALLLIATLLSGCSFNYDVVIVNESNRPIEVRYKIKQDGRLDEPMIKTLEEWHERNGIKRLWSEPPPWQPLPQTDLETVADERVIKILPRRAVRIEQGNHNLISEEKGELTDIVELRLISDHGEISLKGRLLLSHFEKDGYTFFRTHTDETLKDY